MSGRPAARITDPVSHPLPPILTGAPPATTVLIGLLPAWKGIPVAGGAALQAASLATQSALNTAETTAKTAEAAAVTAAPTPGGPAAAAAATAARLAAETAKATAAAADSVWIMAAAAGGASVHACVTPWPIPPHGPGVVIDGSPTVLIENMPATRQGDTIIEAIGPPNKISMGCPTVLIGNMGAAGFGATASGSPVAVQALPSRTPTAAEVQEIQDAIDAGNNQAAINLTVAYYGIDTSNVPGGVQWDATEADYGVTSFAGAVNLGPPAMASPSVLASTIAHETTHANQAAEMRASDPSLTGWPADTVDYDEAVAYDTEVRSAERTGLADEPAELQLTETRRDNHFDNLPPESQDSFMNGGYPP